MKNPMMAIALGLALLLSSCGATVAESSSAPESSASSSKPVAVAAASSATNPKAEKAEEVEAIAQAEETTEYPEIGQIISLQSGDLMCYTVVRDRQGQEFDIGATFEICEQQELLNQNVRFVYSEENVADCQSAEPCGRSRKETLISDVVLLGENWQVLSNGDWTVTVGRIESWDGVNNTGGLTYYGCDSDGNCLSLTDGFTVCRDGICNMSWENGDYAYTLSSEVTDDGEGSTTLIVWQNGDEILRAENMELIDSSDS
ncbi:MULTISPECIES: hypothetical protein [unclassified Leptolyngbya]|uniref:hypothetical protein n=1 Tax=unclassified Leptolyngbya TaxID=2650499 RepID=UPI00168340D2|nr:MULTISPECIES: hypothetical protein [unclassified Leptolyngbya]MBD1910708.1 hypothetical protein [Leptolyngbya sp. FACHB-8]MBD2154305.1 hypothetical protein [Leptolyngbya sp. FACHB-16]